jgi:hypothetical protein
MTATGPARLKRSVSEMARILCPPGKQWWATVVLAAYADGSGQPSIDPVVCIGALVGNTVFWEGFERMWIEFLARFELKRFHAAEFVARRGAFWRWDDEKWNAALAALNAIFDAGRPSPVGCAISVEAFRDWRRQIDHFYPDDPYYYCLDHVLFHLIHGLREAPISEGITIYCDREEQHHLLGAQLAQWHEDKLRRSEWISTYNDNPNFAVDLHYGSNFDYVPLQAADILAHGGFQQMKAMLEQPPGRLPHPLLAALQGNTSGIANLHSAELIELEYRARRRRRT